MVIGYLLLANGLFLLAGWKLDPFFFFFLPFQNECLSMCLGGWGGVGGLGEHDNVRCSTCHMLTTTGPTYWLLYADGCWYPPWSQLSRLPERWRVVTWPGTPRHQAFCLGKRRSWLRFLPLLLLLGSPVGFFALPMSRVELGLVTGWWWDQQVNDGK